MELTLSMKMDEKTRPDYRLIYYEDNYGEFLNLNLENLLKLYLGWYFKALIFVRASILCNSVVLSTFWIGSDNKFLYALEKKGIFFIITRVSDTKNNFKTH